MSCFSFFRSCIYQSDIKDYDNTGKADRPLEPCPRFAHQLVYDHIRKVKEEIFIFAYFLHEK